MSEAKKMHSAEIFVKNFSEIYFEQRDFEAVKNILHENVSWYGTGRHEVCYGIDDACRLLDEERDAWDGRFKITFQKYKVFELNEETCLVMCSINTVEDGLNTILLEMESRVSIVLMRSDDSFKIVHIHCSVPNSAQQEGEFVHKKIVADYNKQLEKKLEERTETLKQKTMELEALANNIRGGVQVCCNDECFTVKYISAGFTELTGYSNEERNANVAEHLSIVYPADKAHLKQEIARQLELGNSFSVEYRIVHKDGHCIWVLDKGRKIKDIKKGEYLQCTLTDINEQKEQENKLRLSEKKYETAMLMTDMVMFEYNIVTRQLILYERDAKLYNVGNIVENGVEAFISRGIVEPDSVAEYRNMYRQIHAGAQSASCCVHARDVMGNIHEYELSLHTVYNVDGVPQRAVGVRKNISNTRRLQREQEFGKALVIGKKFLCEVNTSTDTLIWMDEYYLDSLDASLDDKYTVVMKAISERFIEPDYRELLLKKTSPDYLHNKFNANERLVMFSYKRKNVFGEYIWFEATVSLMRDERTGELLARLYHLDINDRKQKEQRAIEERRIYETMTQHAKLAYEFNITNNVIIKGHENWDTLYGIKKSNNFCEMITAFSQQAIYAEDAAGFAVIFDRNRILEQYKAGERQIVCSYRKPNELGQLRWVCSTMHLYEDPETGDIKCYAYVEDIDEQKKAEIELKFNAEHDIMTGIYNKSTAEKRIEAFLKSELLHGKSHALLIMDIDNFKSVNDTFGHYYGDNVLCEISKKFKAAFRDEDILGRIGGDEFVVLMKNVVSQEAVAAKANEVCAKLLQVYESDGKRVQISASVGAAIFPHHGKNYFELNAYADKALYCAKSSGKNQSNI